MQAVTRKINGQKKEKIDQGSDAGSSLKERLHSRKPGIKIKKIKQNTWSRHEVDCKGGSNTAGTWKKILNAKNIYSYMHC